MDNGKPIRESRDIDVPLLARHFYYHAGWAQLMETELRDYQPVGVVGQIIPWNFPLLMLGWKIAPAIAMGNTVVLKPASYTRLSALLFAEIVAEAGLPPGVVNIITGSSKAGSMIVTHPDVDKIAFTGSTDVGRTLRQQTAGSGKKLSLELGGKSPFVVFEDADLDGAVEGVVDAIWFNQGQVCCAGSRLLVQENVAERFINKLKARMGNLRVGDPLDKCIDMGAIVDKTQWDTVDHWVKTGVSGGRRALPAGYRAAREGLLLPADADHRARPGGGNRAGGDLRTGAGVADLPHAGGGDRAGEQHALRAGCQRVERQHQPGAGCGQQDQGRLGVGQLHQPVRCGRPDSAATARAALAARAAGKGLFEYLRPAWQERPRPQLGAARDADRQIQMG